MTPIITDPTTPVPDPIPPDVVTSPDGILTAAYIPGSPTSDYCRPRCRRYPCDSDAATSKPGGVYLEADYSTIDGKTVDKVRFVRVTDGTEYAVRGGDPALAVGGIAYAYDIEAPLEETSRWYAVPIYTDGTEGPPSEPVALYLPWPEGDLDCWIKPVQDPAASMMCLIIQPLPTFTRASRQQLSAVQGSRLQAGGWDLHLAAEGTFTFWTPDCIERDKIIAALTSGPILFQTRSDYQVDDVYCLPGDLTETTMEYDFRDPGRVWTVPLTPIARPATADGPAVAVGNSYAITHAAAGTYQIRYDTWPTYIDASRPIELDSTNPNTPGVFTTTVPADGVMP